MTTFSNDIDAIARKNEQVILRNLAKTGQVNAAKEIGVDGSTVTRMKDKGGLARFSRLLAAIGLSVYDSDSIVSEPGDHFALLKCAHNWTGAMLNQCARMQQEIDEFRLEREGKENGR